MLKSKSVTFNTSQGSCDLNRSIESSPSRCDIHNFSVHTTENSPMKNEAEIKKKKGVFRRLISNFSSPKKDQKSRHGREHLSGIASRFTELESLSEDEAGEKKEAEEENHSQSTIPSIQVLYQNDTFMKKDNYSKEEDDEEMTLYKEMYTIRRGMLARDKAYFLEKLEVYKLQAEAEELMGPTLK